MSAYREQGSTLTLDTSLLLYQGAPVFRLVLEAHAHFLLLKHSRGSQLPLAHRLPCAPSFLLSLPSRGLSKLLTTQMLAPLFALPLFPRVALIHEWRGVSRL